MCVCVCVCACVCIVWNRVRDGSGMCQTRYVCACVWCVHVEHTSASKLMNLCMSIMLGIFFGGSDISICAHLARAQ